MRRDKTKKEHVLDICEKSPWGKRPRGFFIHKNLENKREREYNKVL